MSKSSSYVRLERRIAATSTDGILIRWRYGMQLLAEKAGRKQLPHGKIDGLVADAVKNGLKLNEREIQRRIKCAEVYGSESKVRRASDGLGSWTAMHEAGFPPIDGDDPDELDADISTAAPDEWEQLSLIPGLGETFKVNGRRIVLTEATIADVESYRDMYAGIHENFAKRLALIENALRLMREGGGTPESNALEAWRRGVST